MGKCHIPPTRAWAPQCVTDSLMRSHGSRWIHGCPRRLRNCHPPEGCIPWKHPSPVGKILGRKNSHRPLCWPRLFCHPKAPRFANAPVENHLGQWVKGRTQLSGLFSAKPVIIDIPAPIHPSGDVRSQSDLLSGFGVLLGSFSVTTVRSVDSIRIGSTGLPEGSQAPRKNSLLGVAFPDDQSRSRI